tara:strand:- start:1508 stop:1714 length:207 start_codon:yes stop_codon:yes gene_type:complete
MGWMKKIYVMCQDGTLDEEFVKPYQQALLDEKDIMYFQGKMITMDQAAAIQLFVDDALKMFKKQNLQQ